MTLAWIGSRLRLLIRSEQGMALPVALLATVASLSLAGAAVMSSIDVQSSSKRDNGSKSAIAAADAGANVAMQRLSRYGDSLSSSKPCLKVNAGGQLEASTAPASEPEWCEEIEGQVGGAGYGYRVSALGSSCAGHDICIVSTGTADDVSRRVLLSLDEDGLGFEEWSQKKTEEELARAKQKESNAKEIKELEERLKKTEEEASSGGGIAGLVGREEITISGSATIGLGVATNGNLVTSGSVDICGDIQTGIGKTWIASGHKSQCQGHKLTQGTIEVPSVSSFIPSDIATHNSNARLTKCSNGLPAECQKDTYNGSWNGTIPFEPKARSINLSGSKTLTVGGGDYWICSITLSGSQELIMADGAHTRFFFDTPEHCGSSNQIAISGNSKIVSTGYKGKSGQFAVPGFYLLGSTTKTSQIAISGTSSGNEFIVYGPNSTIAISGNASKGIVVGKRVTISGSVKLEQDEGFEIPPELNPGSVSEGAVETVKEEKLKKEEEIKKMEDEWAVNDAGSATVGGRTFHAQSYVECSGGATPPGTEPDASC
ncbi:MAG TPA: hypothetical protein VF085_12575 [Solirubrobacterales bacterium]